MKRNIMKVILSAMKSDAVNIIIILILISRLNVF